MFKHAKFREVNTACYSFQLGNFPESNIVLGAGQPEYQPIHAYTSPADPQGTMAFKWRLTWRQRLRVLFTGVIWHEVLTFRHPFQPQRLGCEKPEYISIEHALRKPPQ